MKNVVAVVQARAGSTRLPGKVLQDLAGEPMLVRVMTRLKRARTIDRVVLATTIEPADDAIAAMATEHGWPVFRGSEADVLTRYVGAAREHSATHVVRVTSDCPITDPALVDEHVTRLLERRVDFVSNMTRPTFPLGLAVEALPIDVLARLDRLSPTLREREHVTRFIYDRPDLFLVDHVVLEEDLSQSMRLTVDTPEDMTLARAVFEHFGHDAFAWREAVDFVRSRPDLVALNRHVQQKVV